MKPSVGRLCHVMRRGGGRTAGRILVVLATTITFLLSINHLSTNQATGKWQGLSWKTSSSGTAKMEPDTVEQDEGRRESAAAHGLGPGTPVQEQATLSEVARGRQGQLDWEPAVPGNNHQATGDLDTPVDLNMTAIELEMTSRSQHVTEICKDMSSTSPDYRKFYIDRKHRLAWCPIYKAASSSWLENFCVLGGGCREEGRARPQGHSLQMNHLARRAFPTVDIMLTKTMIDISLSFIIVRHPFERLLSAYRDKLEKREKREWYYQKYGKKIVQMFRNRKRMGNRVYENFLKRRIHKQSENGSGEVRKVDAGGKKLETGPEPTFEEFVLFLIKTKNYDEHWRPFYKECAPCVVHYDVIAKFETLQRDQNYIILKQNLQHLLKPKWSHKNKEGKTAKVAQKYFSQVTREDIVELYEKYREDFLLFDYSPDRYVDMGKREKRHN